METIIYQVDAFTNEPFSGNPAGVVPDARGLTKKDMQKIAKEMNLSETAFINKIDSNSFEVRFFTPIQEVDLCGHATIASFYVLGEKGYIRSEGRKMVTVTQKTKSGLLPVDIYFNNDRVEKVLMYQKNPESYGTIHGLETIPLILGIEKEQLGLDNFFIKPEVISTGLKDVIVPIKNEEILASLNVNFEKMMDLCISNDAIGFHVFTLSKEKEDIAYCRNFAPLVGIREEAATGTANGALIYYLKKNGLLKTDTLIAKQGQYINRPSEIICKINEEEKKNIVIVGGQAVIVMEGVIKI